ncbi:MAG: hypothetical protein HY720_00885 [Planctomycetes bacterium]|nr:hypothetical protein [Planctomycetota bacterium]
MPPPEPGEEDRPGEAARAVPPRPLPRIVLGLALVVFFAAAFSILEARVRKKGQFPDYSGFSSREGGLRAFVLYATSERGIPVRLFKLRATTLPRREPGTAALMLVRPGVGGDAIDKDEVEPVRSWVGEQGNLLVLVDDRPSAVAESFGLAIQPAGAPAGAWEAADPDLPLAARAKNPTGAGSAWIRVAEGRRDVLVLFRGAGKPKAVYHRFGKGDVLVFADPYPFTNAGIRATPESENPFLVSNLVDLFHDRTLYLDEYHHGFVRQAELHAYLEVLGLGPFFFQLAGTALLVFLAMGRRLGPPIPLVVDPRRDSFEYAEARADLFRRLGHRKYCVQALWMELSRAVARFAPPGAGEKKLDEVLASHARFPIARYRALDKQLRRFAPAASAAVGDGRLVKLAREVDSFLSELRKWQTSQPT